MSQIRKLTVGWTGRPVAIELWCPIVPKSYVKDDARARWLEEHMADAPILPYVSVPHEIVVLDEKGQPLGQEVHNADSFYDLAEAFGQYSKLQPGETPEDKIIFLGFNVKQLFQSVAATRMQRGLPVAQKFWHNPPNLMDISEVLIPGPLRNGFDAGSLLAYMGNEVPPHMSHLVGPGQCAMNTAAEKADVARLLAQFAQLI